jgi:excisionase family DNA binding protein
VSDELKPLAVPDKEAARLLGIGKSTLWANVKAGKLPAPIHIGGATRWRVSDLERHLQAMSPTTP